MATKEEVSRRSGGWSRESKISLGSGVKIVGREFFHWFRGFAAKARGMQESQTEEEEMGQQQRVKVETDKTKRIKSKGRMDANNSWWVSELRAADCNKAWLRPGWEDTMLHWYTWQCDMKKDMSVLWSKSGD